MQPIHIESLLSPLPQNQTEGTNKIAHAKTLSSRSLLMSLNTKNSFHNPAKEKIPKNKVMMRYLLKLIADSTAEIYITNKLESMPKYPA